MIALAVRRIGPALLAEARGACVSLGLPTEDWGGGIPRTSPRVVITSIEPGERRIPEDVCGLLDASPGVRAVVCASEPLVRPRIDLANGRVTLLSPPIDRMRLVAALRSSLDLLTPLTTPDAAGARRFEVMRGSYWVAWARGADAQPVQIDESRGLTVLFGDGDVRPVAQLASSDLGDEALATGLAALVGDRAVLHLGEDGAEWRCYSPPGRRLWMCSAERLPALWKVDPTLGASRVVRMGAFPGDQLVAGAAPKPPPEKAFEPLHGVMLEGGAATIGELATLTAKHSAFVGAVIEVR